MAQYDADILQKFADNLYAKARWIILQCGFGGAVIGVLLVVIPITVYPSTHTDTAAQQEIIDRYKGTGNGFEVPLRDHRETSANDSSAPIGVGAVALGFIGFLLGVSIGQKKAFQYKLQAQLTLCQMQTEFNTRSKSQPMTA